MNQPLIGEPLKYNKEDMDALIDLVLEGKLEAKKIECQSDGDIRYWGVEPVQNPILSQLKELSEGLFVKRSGRPPAFSFIHSVRFTPV